MNNPKEEKTLVLIKPDGVVRGLIGETISRFERRGLKIIALNMATPTKQQMDDHYPKDEKWICRLGEKTLHTYAKYHYNAMKELGTTDAMEIGKMVRSWLIDFMTSAPIVKMVVQGVHAIDMIRKISGNTMPALADAGTIRGDYSVDSAAAANKDKRAVKNIIHASETPEEASHEIAHWFSKDEIFAYKRNDEDIAY